MLVFIIRRTLQSAVALLVMSALIFVGVFAIGDPIDILINPQADQAEIVRATAALGLDQPMWVQDRNSCATRSPATWAVLSRTIFRRCS